MGLVGPRWSSNAAPSGAAFELFHAEWTTFRDRRPVGIPSPVEQNRRHIAVLDRAIELGYVELPRRFVAIKPTFHNRVLVSTEGSIGRPPRKLPELDAVVKVDQFRTHLLKRNFSNLTMLKLVGSDTLEAFGRQLVALHQPHRAAWAKRFRIPPMDPAVTAPIPSRAPASKERKPSGIACASCGTEVSTAEAHFCRINKPRFGGQILCIACQQRIAPLHRP